MISQSAALLQRALRVDARLIRSHFFRIALLGFLIFALYDAQSHPRIGAPGLEFFGLIQLCNFWFVTFAGVTFFATAITEEKEESTLSLLKMAGISALALLTGKWAPRVIAGVLLLTVQLPFTMLAITLGGVLWDQVIAAYCTQVAHLVLVGCVGVFASVVSARSTGACVAATLILAALFISPPLLLAIMAGLQGRSVMPASMARPLEGILDELIRAAPLTRLAEIQTTNFNDPPVGFQVVSNMVAGVAFFGLAWLLFGICTRHDSTARPAVRWWARLSRWRRQRSRRAWDSALLWKDFYFAAGGPPVLVVKLFGYAVLVIAAAGYLFLLGPGRSGPLSSVLSDFGDMTMGLMLLALLLETAVIAARCYRVEIRRQTWASLCMLPRNLSDVAYQKVASHGLSLIPVAIWFWLGALLAPNSVIDFLDAILDDADVFLAFVYAASQIVWFLHVIALLSVTIDWAAWPVSIFCGGLTVVLWNVMFLTCLEEVFVGAGPGTEAVLFLLCMFGCGQVAFTHWLIGERLHILAGR